jgi:predicted transcriptional regulator
MSIVVIDNRHSHIGAMESILLVSKISIRQVKAARELLGWAQSDLARESGVSEPTIKRLEAQGGEIGGREETAGKIVAALERHGVEFIGQSGVKLRR